MNEVKRFRVLLRSIYRGRAWHGPSVRETLDGLSAEAAAASPEAGSHSIWELVLHMTYWRRIVVAALAGAAIDEHPPTEMNWPAVDDTSPEAWQGALADLAASQQELEASLRSVDDSRLAENITGRDYSFYFLLHGIVHHDLYHVGQIALLKKL